MFCPQSSPSIDKAREIFQREGPRVVSHPDGIAFPEARKLTGDAFGGKVASKGDPIIVSMTGDMGVLSEERTKDRQELAAFCMGFFVYELLEKGGTAVGIKEDGKLKAVAVFREYDPEKEFNQFTIIKKITGFFRSIRAYMAMKNDSVGHPEILSDKAKEKQFQECSSVYEPCETILGGWHKEQGPKEKHWYVGIIASDPEMQGKGYGKELMQMMGRAADECGMKCYLECADSRKAFYEKFGYEAAGHNTLYIGKGEDAKHFPGYTMIRPCKQ